MNPSFDLQGGKGRFCASHKMDGMIDVKSKRCEHDGCNVMNPSFDLQGGKGRFCASHKMDGMIDVKSKRCEHDGCNVMKPLFDLQGGKGRFCARHKMDGMIDVKSKRCEHDGCNVINPVFNVEGGNGRFCVKHKENCMVDVKSKRCEHDGCNSQPSFDVEGGKGRFCVKHKIANMVNVRSKRCLLCPTFSSQTKYKGYCYRCFIHTFPDNTIVRNHKTKERTVADYVKAHFPNYDISFDKRIDGGCSARRPDILIDLGHRVIIIEIDENQHGTYDCSCENKRLMQLFEDGGMRPMTFVRFNPDQYFDHKQTAVPSCWGLTKDRGICVVKEGKKKEWDRRLQVLQKHVHHVCENGGEKEIDIIHLYYNGWSL